MQTFGLGAVFSLPGCSLEAVVTSCWPMTRWLASSSRAQLAVEPPTFELRRKNVDMLQ